MGELRKACFLLLPLAAAALVGLVALPQAEAKTVIEGRWDLRMPRPGRLPAEGRATLMLLRRGSKWYGHITFRMLLHARRQQLVEFDATPTRFACRVDFTDLDVRLEGQWKKGGLQGRCLLDGRWYPWTATRATAPSRERFEKGLSFRKPFEKGKAEDLGLDGGALDELVGAAHDADSDALLVLKDGKIVCERYFGRKQGRIHIMSVTKFLTAIAVARLLEDKKLPSPDAPLSTWFRDWKQGRKAAVTLRHLLTHTSGIAHGSNARELNRQQDKVAYVRNAEVEKPPGTEHSYNNDAVALLSGILARAGGRPVDTYLRQKLFAPLGIKDWSWDRDEAGHTLTYANLAMTARDLALVGRVIADEGRLGKRKFLKPTSVNLLGSTATPLEKTQGLLWRLRLDATGEKVRCYYHTGWLGQFLVVYPEENLVGVRLRRWKSDQDAENPAHEFGRFLSLLESLVRR